VVRGFILNIMAYHLTVDTRKIEVSHPNAEGHYQVTWENRPIGFIFVAELNDVTGRPIWHGNSPELDEVAAEIGVYIEAADM
jgi:hypothetical protein